MSEEIPAALDGERLDRVVAMVTGASRAEASARVAAGDVRVNGVVVTDRTHRVTEGDRLDVAPLESAPPTLVGDPSVTFEVVYADDDIVVVDKPAGLVVHPGAGSSTGTLVHGLLASHPEIATVGDPGRPGIVHRLDKGTSGLIVVARSRTAYDALVAALAAHAVERSYVALAWGRFDTRRGVIDAPIGRSARTPTRMAVTAKGRPARTRYEVRGEYHDPVEVSLIGCELETGRTHQIRVHLASIGHSVVGDDRYGGARQSLPLGRPFLHAERLGLVHPTTGQELVFHSPMPDDLLAVLTTLR